MIGNDEYGGDLGLTHAVSSAHAVAERLTELEYSVVSVSNAALAEMQAFFEAFRDSLLWAWLARHEFCGLSPSSCGFCWSQPRRCVVHLWQSPKESSLACACSIVVNLSMRDLCSAPWLARQARACR